MTVEAPLLALMPHTVTVRARTGIDGYGKPSYAAGTSVRARVSFRPTKVRGADGQDVVARGTAILSEPLDVSPHDRLTLPDGSEPPILASAKVPDAKGFHHTSIFFG